MNAKLIINQKQKLKFQNEQTLTYEQSHKPTMQALKNCLQHNHPVSYICFDPKCIQTSQQIMCNDCAQQHNKNHTNHRVLEYSSFKKYVHTFRNQIEYQEIKEIIREQFWVNILSQFVILKADVMRQINDVEDSVMATISLEFGEEHEFQVFQGEIALLTKNELFNKYVINTSSLNMIKEEMKLKNMNLLKEIRNLNQELTKVFESQKKQINLPQINKAFLFSSKNKHENLQVLENGIIIRCTGKQTQGTLGHSQLSLCKQPFSPIANKIQFMIKQMSSRNCVTIGACLLSQVKKNKFFKCWQLGQGTYSLFVNTFGQVKSNHHSNKLHSDVALKGWKMSKGDIISVQIDFMREKIVFIKNGKDQFSMPVDIGIEKLYPFVAVSYVKDCIQVL